MTKIYIDQGHNPEGINAGAEGFGLREQDINYAVGIRLRDILQADGAFRARHRKRRSAPATRPVWPRA